MGEGQHHHCPIHSMGGDPRWVNFSAQPINGGGRKKGVGPNADAPHQNPEEIRSPRTGASPRTKRFARTLRPKKGRTFFPALTQKSPCVGQGICP